MLRKRKSYLSKLFFSFIGILIVPVLVIIIVNVQCQRLVKENIILSNQKVMSWAYELLDKGIVEMRDICISISAMDELDTYMNRQVTNTNQGYYRYNIANLLKNLDTDRCKDVLVYFQQDNYIVSSRNSAMTSEAYCRTYHRGIGDEQLLKILTCENVYPKFFVLEKEDGTVQFAVSMKKKIYSGRSVVIAVMLDSTYVDTLLYRNSDSLGADTLIFGEDLELLYATDEDIAYDMDDYGGSNQPFQTSFANRSYIMQVYKSEDLRTWYAFAIPETYFWQNFVTVRFFSISGIVVCILLGVWFSYYGSKRTYAPVGRLMSQMKDVLQSGHNVMEREAQDEFEFIEMIFKNEKEQKNLLIRDMERSREQAAERFLNLLTEGRFEGKEQVDVFKKYGINLCSNRFLIAVMQIEDMGTVNEDLNSFIIKNVFEELGDQIGKCYVISKSIQKSVLIFNVGNDRTEQDVKDRVKEGMQFFEMYARMTLSVGLGSLQEGSGGIASGYMEASEALKYSYLLEKGSMILWEEVKDRFFAYPSFEKLNLYSMIENHLLSKRKNEQEFVEEIFRTYRIDASISMDTMECFRFELMNAVNRVSHVCNYSQLDRQKWITGIAKQKTLTDLRDYLCQMLETFAIRKKENSNDSISSQTKAYIAEHYARTELSVNFLAEKMGYSVSWLSRLYKEKYGVSILEDITRTRINRSKDLLRDKKLSVSEVAKASGFLSDNVYVKTFKKWEGITPGRYRELENTDLNHE